MDRDVAMSINGTIGTINAGLQKIINGITNSANDNRSVPDDNQRTVQEDIPEEEPEPITETPTRKKSTSK